MRRGLWHPLALLAMVALSMLGPVGPAGAQRQQTVVVAFGVDPFSLDPQHDATTWITSIHLELFDPLLIMNDKMEVEPGLAESWKAISSKVWEFKLRKGVKFHDGSELTADDVKFTMDRITDRKVDSVWWSRMRWLAETKVIDRYTVRIRTEPAYAPALRGLTYMGPIMPKTAFERVGAQRFGQSPIGTGPYRFVEWVKNDRVVLQANDQYWKGRPRVDRLIFRTIPDEFTRVAELKTGGIDIATNLSPSRAGELRTAPNAQVATVRSLRQLFIGMNMKKKPFDDVRVRRALNHAVNVDELIKVVLNGHAYRNSSPVPGLAFGYNSDVIKYDYNPQKARQLLAEAGVPQGTTVVFEAPRGRYLADKELAEAIAGYLEAVGLKVDLRVQEWGTYWPKFLGQRIEGLYMVGCGAASADADQCLDLHLHTDSRGAWYGQGYRDLDAMIMLAKSLPNAKVRMDLYSRIQKAVTERAPWIFLFDFDDIYGVKKGLNWKPRPDERVIVQ
jgi:peptide/nickel transport system substrate-binding protein